MSCFLVLRVFHEFFRRDGKIINELIAIGKKIISNSLQKCSSFTSVSKNEVM